MFRCFWSATKNANTYSKNIYIRRRFLFNPTPLRSHSQIINSILTKRINAENFNEIQIKSYSNNILDGNVSKYLDKNDQDRISEIFPNPRVTLNELASKLPQKIFETQFRQTVVTPKVGKSKKKSTQSNDWICNYLFLWPEKIKFESTALSKKQAADKAAIQALQWLYTNRHINRHGNPVYDQNELDCFASGLNKPFCAEMSCKSVARIERIWMEYEEGIKDIFIKTHNEAISKTYGTPVAVTKDSTVDIEDFSDEELSKATNKNNIYDTDTKSMHPVFCAPVAPPGGRARRRRPLEHSEWTALPADGYSEQIKSTLDNSRTLVIIGAAGCGKSTRIPTSLLSQLGSECHAIVSEPRRVAAISLAERVASEMGEEVGNSVGYQVRLKCTPPRPPGGAVLFATSGVLLRRLQTNAGLHGCTHVFIDEAHERDVNTDLTLLLLKRAMSLNPELKVIVMSATLNADVFSRYFDSSPVIEIPGRTYPVEAMYLDDLKKEYNIPLTKTYESCAKDEGKAGISCNEIAEIIKCIDKRGSEGGILVFLPGWAEIKLVKKMLDEEYGTSGHLILPVHSRLTSEDQSKMFARPIPGVRKIVLSTNIAETSVTIPDVTHVVDCGVHKENRLLHSGISSLDTVWISKAAAKQRMGRAGRVQAGRCYKMYTREKENQFNEHTTPEILRVPLDQVVLSCKSYAPSGNIEDFLAQLPEPPSKKSVRLALYDLIDLGALNQDQSLTPLGRKLSVLPIPPRLALSLLHSVVTCTVGGVAFVVGGVEPAGGERTEIRELKRKYSQTSDHAALYYIQEEYERTRRVNELLRRDKLMHAQALTNLHLEHLFNTVQLRNSEEIDQIDKYSSLEQLLSAVLLSGCDRLLVSRKRLSTKGRLKMTGNVYTSTGERAHISSQSVNHNISKSAAPQPAVLVHCWPRHSAARGALLAGDTSRVAPHTVLLFARGDCVVTDSRDDLDSCIMKLAKHNIEVIVPKNQADVILKAREMLWQTFQFYYERDLENLDLETENLVFRFKMRLVKAIGEILLEAESDLMPES